MADFVETGLKDPFVMAFLSWELLMCGVYAAFCNFSSDGSATGDYSLYQDVHAMVFVGFGLLVTFMRKYGFSSLGHNFLIAAFAIQWGIIVIGFWDRAFTDFSAFNLDVTDLIRGDLAAVTCLITFGAILGRATPMQTLVLVGLEIVFYGLNRVLLLTVLKNNDFGGSMYIHVFGGIFGVTASGFMTPTSVDDDGKGENRKSVYQSDVFTMIALAPVGQTRIVVNTILSLTTSCIITYLCSRTVTGHKRFSMVDVQNATLAGGVAIGSSASMVVGPWGSILTGMVAGFCSVIGFARITPWLEVKLGAIDSRGVFSLHVIPGLIGALGGIFSALDADGDTAYGDPVTAIFPGRAEGWSHNKQSLYQFFGLLVTIGMGTASGLICGAFLGTCLFNQRQSQNPYVDTVAWKVPQDEIPFFFDERAMKGAEEDGGSFSVSVIRGHVELGEKKAGRGAILHIEAEVEAAEDTTRDDAKDDD